MFQNEPVGARAMASYYMDALDWSYALGEDPTPFMVVCDAERCRQNEKIAAQNRALHRHLVGGRQYITSLATIENAVGTGADIVVQLHLDVEAAKFVEASGKVIRQSGPKTMVINLYMHWNQKMWRVIGDYLAD